MPAPVTRGSPLEIGRARAKRLGYSMPSPVGRSKVWEARAPGALFGPEVAYPARAPGPPGSSDTRSWEMFSGWQVACP